jgi:nickel-dependent lactate racemase
MPVRVPSIASQPETIGQGLAEGFLSPGQIYAVVRDGLGQLDLDGRRVLVIIPDSTRTMPMPLLFGILEKELVSRAARLDFLIANGTHRAMSDVELSRHTGREVAAGRAGSIRIFNHDQRGPQSIDDSW